MNGRYWIHPLRGVPHGESSLWKARKERVQILGRMTTIRSDHVVPCREQDLDHFVCIAFVGHYMS
jgi:hypothetical protein